MEKVAVLLGIYLVVPALLMFLQARWPAVQKIGAILLAYAVGIVLSLTGFSQSADAETARQIVTLKAVLQNVCVPLGIPLLLFSSDFKQWRRRWKQVAVAFAVGIVAVMAAVTASYYLFRGQGIPELEKAAGLMVGFYTGGTPNVASLKMALQPSAETFLLVNSFEIVITFVLLAFLIGGGYKLVRRWLPYAKPSAAVTVAPVHLRETLAARRALARAGKVEDYRFMFRKPMLRGWLCALGLAVLIALAAALVSLLFPLDYRVVVIVLGITTLSIAASFSER
ncbi:MAG: DUF819 family protein, partial [Bacteroidales bacterium]|nr:DUF819 family protein [Bacteroidales bacterium]